MQVRFTGRSRVPVRCVAVRQRSRSRTRRSCPRAAPSNVCSTTGDLSTSVRLLTCFGVSQLRLVWLHMLHGPVAWRGTVRCDSMRAGPRSVTCMCRHEIFTTLCNDCVEFRCELRPVASCCLLAVQAATASRLQLPKQSRHPLHPPQL